MVQKKVIPFILIGVLVGLSFTVSESYAHAPTAVSLSDITETTMTINWTHSGDAGQGTPCVAAIAASTCLTDVDIMRVPGQLGSTNYTTLVSNSTAYVVANNATGLSTWTDHSLPEGTVFAYQVCHTETAKASCLVADTNGTNEGKADTVFISCTGLRTIGAIEALEADLGRPVVSAIQATFWDALCIAKVHDVQPGFGSLFDHWV